LRLAPHERELCETVLGRRGLPVTLLSGVRELVRALSDCEFLLLGRPPPGLDYGPAGRLRLLQIAGSGVDPLFPVLGLHERVAIAHCAEAHADAVRDHVLGLILALARDLPRAIAQRARREWQPYASAPLRGKEVVLLGYGAIGRRVARTLAGFGVRVRAVRRRAEPAPELFRVHPPEELLEAVKNADYLVVCVPLTGRTRGLVDARVLGALPERAAVVSVSRGEILDETALARALRSGQLSGAAVDGFASEPLPPTSPLWHCPGLLVTPHSAGYEPAHLAPIFESFAENVERVARGEPALELVSREHEY
jgi:phosphoglycerate dehydrogenase-like enzyme